MNLNVILLFFFSFFTLLFFPFVTVSQLLSVKQLTPKLFTVDSTGSNKYTATIEWDGTLNDDNQKLESDFACYPNGIVTVENTPQYPVFGDRKVSFDFTVQKTGNKISCACLTEIDPAADGDGFAYVTTFQV